MKKLINLYCILLLLSSCTYKNSRSEYNSQFSQSVIEGEAGISSSNDYFALKTSDIKCKEIDDFYSIYSLRNNKILIIAGNSNNNDNNLSHLIIYDLDAKKDSFIMDLLDAVLYVDVVDNDTFCISTYSQIHIISNEEKIKTITLEPEKTFDFRYSYQANSLCYVDNESNLVIQDLESKEINTIFSAQPIQNSHIERGAYPYFFNAGQKIAFLKTGIEDFSSLFIYDLKEQLLYEYPANILIYQHNICSYHNGDDLIITSHEDNSKTIYVYDNKKMDKYNLDILYEETYQSPYDLLIRGADNNVYKINLFDYSAEIVFDLNQDYTVSDMISTENYFAILKTYQNLSEIIFVNK